MRIELIICSLIISLTANAQNITYNDLVTTDWNDHPFSIVELLIEKGYEYSDKRIIDQSFETGDQTRESLYELSYMYFPTAGAFVCVDEFKYDNAFTDWPILKLVFTHAGKSQFNSLSEEIKLNCGEPVSEFYFCPNSLAFKHEKGLSEGKPFYTIYIYRLTRETFEEGMKMINDLLDELIDE